MLQEAGSETEGQGTQLEEGGKEALPKALASCWEKEVGEIMSFTGRSRGGFHGSARGGDLTPARIVSMLEEAVDKY